MITANKVFRIDGGEPPYNFEILNLNACMTVTPTQGVVNEDIVIDVTASDEDCFLNTFDIKVVDSNNCVNFLNDVLITNPCLNVTDQIILNISTEIVNGSYVITTTCSEDPNNYNFSYVYNSSNFLGVSTLNVLTLNPINTIGRLENVNILVTNSNGCSDEESINLSPISFSEPLPVVSNMEFRMSCDTISSKVASQSLIDLRTYVTNDEFIDWSSLETDTSKPIHFVVENSKFPYIVKLQYNNEKSLEARQAGSYVTATMFLLKTKSGSNTNAFTIGGVSSCEPVVTGGGLYETQIQLSEVKLPNYVEDTKGSTEAFTIPASKEILLNGENQKVNYVMKAQGGSQTVNSIKNQVSTPEGTTVQVTCDGFEITPSTTETCDAIAFQYSLELDGQNCNVTNEELPTGTIIVTNDLLTPPVLISEITIGSNCKTPSSNILISDILSSGTYDKNSLEVKTQPVKGDLINNLDGTFYYKPNLKFSRNDSVLIDDLVTFTIKSPEGVESNEIIVNIRREQAGYNIIRSRNNIYYDANTLSFNLNDFVTGASNSSSWTTEDIVYTDDGSRYSITPWNYKEGRDSLGIDSDTELITGVVDFKGAYPTTYNFVKTVNETITAAHPVYDSVITDEIVLNANFSSFTAGRIDSVTASDGGRNLMFHVPFSLEDTLTNIEIIVNGVPIDINSTPYVRAFALLGNTNLNQLTFHPGSSKYFSVFTSVFNSSGTYNVGLKVSYLAPDGLTNVTYTINNFEITI